jgi:hypothetical protein
MHARSLLFLPVMLAAFALPVAPALAGDPEDGEDPPPVVAPVVPPAPTLPAPAPAPLDPQIVAPLNGTATLRAQSCVSRTQAQAVVTGERIASVVFFLDGRRVDTDAGDSFEHSTTCSHLRPGAHRARVVVRFQPGVTPVRRTLRFLLVRRVQTTPRFAG